MTKFGRPEVGEKIVGTRSFEHPDASPSMGLRLRLLGLKGSGVFLLLKLELGLKCNFRAARFSRLERRGEVTRLSRTGERISLLFSEGKGLVRDIRDCNILTDPLLTVGVVMQVERGVVEIDVLLLSAKILILV